MDMRNKILDNLAASRSATGGKATSSADGQAASSGSKFRVLFAGAVAQYRSENPPGLRARDWGLVAATPQSMATHDKEAAQNQGDCLCDEEEEQEQEEESA